MDTQLGKDLALLSANKTAIKNAIEAKGITVGAAKLSEYAAKIAAIEGGGGSTPPTDDWTPNPTWFDIESIVSNDVQAGYTYKIIQLLPDNEVSTSFSGGVAYKTSDGTFYNTTTATHTWNTANDQQCVENGVNTYKTRWVITYFNAQSVSLSTAIKANVLYIIFKGIHMNGGTFNSKSFLQSIKFLDGANISGFTSLSAFFYFCASLVSIPLFDTSTVTNFSKMFQSCYSLETIPLFDTSAGTNFSSMFQRCYSLVTIPLFDTSAGTDFSSMFQYCYALETIPLFDTSAGTNFNYMFQSCYSLETIPLFDTSAGTNFYNMFESCYALETIPLLDTSAGTYFNYMFKDCPSLITIPPLNTSLGLNFGGMFHNCGLLQFIPQLDVPFGTDFGNLFYSNSSLFFIGGLTNLSKSMSLSSSSYLSHDALMNVINNLKDLTGFTAQTLTLGSTNLAKLSAAEKAVATNKNWTLA